MGWKTVKLIKKYCRIFQKVGSCDYPDLTLACGVFSDIGQTYLDIC